MDYASIRRMREALGRDGHPPRARHKPLTHRPRYAPITKATFLTAIRDSHGDRTLIAERIGCSRGHVVNKLNDPAWVDVRAEYDQELERLADFMEGRIKLAAEQTLDVATMSRTAQWYLSRPRHRNRGLGDETKTIVEGGDKPVQVEHTNLVRIEELGLPIEVMRAIWAAIEAKQKAKELPAGG